MTTTSWYVTGSRFAVTTTSWYVTKEERMQFQPLPRVARNVYS